MYHYNGTCAISRLPISGGEKIVCIPLVHHTECSDMLNSYPDDGISPIGFPIIGTYDDCGGIKNFTLSEESKLFYGHFSYYPVDCNARNSMHPMKYSDFISDSDFISEVFCKSKYSIKNHSVSCPTPEYVQLSCMMIHYDLYTNLVNDIKNRCVNEPDMSYETYLDEVIHHAYHESFNMKKPDGSIQYASIANTLFLTHNYRGKLYLTNMAVILMNHPELSEKIIKQIIEHRLFYTIVDNLRCGYGANCGTGNLSNETRLHIVTADFIRQYVSDKAKSNIKNFDINKLSRKEQVDFEKNSNGVQDANCMY